VLEIWNFRNLRQFLSNNASHGSFNPCTPFAVGKNQRMNNGYAGHREWISTALVQHEGGLLRYAQRVTGDAERARDVVQETFLKLCGQNRHELDGHLTEWLYTVCRNKALDVRRKEQRMSILAEEGLAVQESAGPTPLDQVEQNDSAGRLLSLLDRLPENQQEVIRLKFQGSLSYREIARITGLSVSNVGFLIHTGLKTLRSKMTRIQINEI
jgi:RNA polymerase sigma factor (sigma-70 family)